MRPFVKILWPFVIIIIVIIILAHLHKAAGGNIDSK